MVHELAKVLDGVAHGVFPEPNGRVEVVGAPPDGPGAIVCFTAHTYVALDIEPEEVAARAPAGELSVPMSTGFVQWAAARTGTVDGGQDLVFCALARGGPPEVELELVDEHDHARVARAALHRDTTRIYVTRDRDALVVLGRGLTRRWELAFEVEPHARGAGVGRRIAMAARTLLPAGTPIWAQVAPGNAQSVRAVMAAGFVPIGSEVLCTRPS
jgi:GNAT superfamily N-acetyltransferase